MAGTILKPMDLLGRKWQKEILRRLKFDNNTIGQGVPPDPSGMI